MVAVARSALAAATRLGAPMMLAAQMRAHLERVTVAARTIEDAAGRRPRVAVRASALR
jgi:hypothetical protein